MGEHRPDGRVTVSRANGKIIDMGEGWAVPLDDDLVVVAGMIDSLNQLCRASGDDR
jgi:hypothetical protein